jgi:hypothetical protein
MKAIFMCSVLKKLVCRCNDADSSRSSRQCTIDIKHF